MPSVSSAGSPDDVDVGGRELVTRGLRNGRQLGFDGRRMVVPSPPQRLADPLRNRHPAPAGRRLNLQVFGVFEQNLQSLAHVD